MRMQTERQVSACVLLCDGDSPDERDKKNRGSLNSRTEEVWREEHNKGRGRHNINEERRMQDRAKEEEEEEVKSWKGATESQKANERTRVEKSKTLLFTEVVRKVRMVG